MAEIVVDAADFDGTNDFLSASVGSLASKTGIFSVWCRLDGGDGSSLRVFNVAARVFIGRLSTGEWSVTGRNAGNTEVLNIATSATFTAGASWRHFLASWDLAASVAHLYVNDVSDMVTTTLDDDTISWTVTAWSVGALSNGTSKFNGALAELYCAPGQYLDFSVEANRRKFRSALGFPMDLGSDGSLPTGVAPAVYQSVRKGEAASVFATNRGSGGSFAITGALDIASSSPSDGLLLPTTGHIVVTGRQASISRVLTPQSGHLAITGNTSSVARVFDPATSHLLVRGNTAERLVLPPSDLDIRARASGELDMKWSLAPAFDMKWNLVPELDLKQDIPK